MFVLFSSHFSATTALPAVILSQGMRQLESVAALMLFELLLWDTSSAEEPPFLSSSIGGPNRATGLGWTGAAQQEQNNAHAATPRSTTSL